MVSMLRISLNCSMTSITPCGLVSGSLQPFRSALRSYLPKASLVSTVRALLVCVQQCVLTKTEALLV